MRKKKGEPFWDYIERFNIMVIIMKDVYGRMKWYFLEQGLRKETKFVKTIGIEALMYFNYLLARKGQKKYV